MERKVPDDLKYTLHILMIRHGRNDCEARNPTHDTKIRKWCSAYEEK
jgi:endonuclease III